MNHLSAGVEAMGRCSLSAKTGRARPLFMVASGFTWTFMPPEDNKARDWKKHIGWEEIPVIDLFYMNYRIFNRRVTPFPQSFSGFAIG